jgi:hypothetical protein
VRCTSTPTIRLHIVVLKHKGKFTSSQLHKLYCIDWQDDYELADLYVDLHQRKCTEEQKKTTEYPKSGVNLQARY